MKMTIARNNAELFHIALMISKKTSTIATIKYEEVTLSYGEIEIALLFDEKINQPQLVISKDNDRIHWRLSMPCDMFASVEKIEAIASIVLGVTRNHYAHKPSVSVPTRYLEQLFELKEIWLDQRFVITDSEMRKTYEIRINGDDFSFTLFGDKVPFCYSSVYLLPRSIKGNE